MREESHLDEMRTAIRGDFERLAERRGEQELMRVIDGSPEPDGVREPEQAVDAGPVDEPETAPETETQPQRSWLARFLSP